VESGEIATSPLVEAVRDRQAHAARLRAEGKLKVARSALSGGLGVGEGEGEEREGGGDRVAAALKAAERAAA
jgi:hypothetical protein